MTTKQRIRQLEQERTAAHGAKEVHFMADTFGENIVDYDGVKMTRQEAAALIAALPDNKNVLVVYLTHTKVPVPNFG